jgi:hypothetical protein
LVFLGGQKKPVPPLERGLGMPTISYGYEGCLEINTKVGLYVAISIDISGMLYIFTLLSNYRLVLHL